MLHSILNILSKGKSRIIGKKIKLDLIKVNEINVSVI